MSVSVGKLVDQVNSKILAGGQDAINTARLVGAVEAIESRYSVANLAALPPAADNTGRFIFVEDIGSYRYSDGTQWTNDYDTTISTNKQLWGWGWNRCGELGDGTTTSKCSPIREISSSNDWSLVSTGLIASIAIKSDGSLWTWGRNSYGTLGDGTTINKCSPVREISSSVDWCKVSAGNNFMMAIKTSGQIWAWGYNYGGGRLGDGTFVHRSSPVREFCSATDWCQVSAGRYHTLALKTSGQLWSWGSGGSGVLGDGTVTTKRSPVLEISSSTDWCSIAASGSSSAIKTTGELWSWGSNSCGKLGDGTTTNKCSPVREISSSTNWCFVAPGGAFHSVAIKTSGQLWSWGNNNRGEGGTGGFTGGGAFSCSPIREFCSATDWCVASLTSFSTSAIKTNGQLWSWGYANLGTLGDGTTVNKCSPVREICSFTDWFAISNGANGFSGLTAIRSTVGKGFNEP